MDGAPSALTTLFRVILPVARPGVVAVIVYSFITRLGELLFAQALTGQFENLRTLSVGLTEYSSETAVFWNQIMAASLVVSVPIVVVDSCSFSATSWLVSALARSSEP